MKATMMSSIWLLAVIHAAVKASHTISGEMILYQRNLHRHAASAEAVGRAGRRCFSRNRTALRGSQYFEMIYQ